MASDLAASFEFYRRWFDAVVVADFDYAGARNVFGAVGSGRLHFFDQPCEAPIVMRVIEESRLPVYPSLGLAPARTLEHAQLGMWERAVVERRR
jgi:hypothetical protein